MLCFILLMCDIERRLYEMAISYMLVPVMVWSALPD